MYNILKRRRISLSFFIVASFILIISWVNIACTQKKGRRTSRAANEDLFNRSSIEYAFKLDSVTSLHTNFIDVVSINGQEYIAFVNSSDNSIRFFSLASHQETEPIIISKTGVGGVKKVAGFIFVNTDSIFVFGEHGDDMIMINLMGEVQKDFFKVRSTSGEELFGFGRRAIHTVSKPIYQKNMVFLSGFPMYDLSDLYTYYANSNLEMEIDLISQSYQYLNIFYPPVYNRKSFFELNSNRNRVYNPRTGKFVMNFASDHNLWEVDGSTDPIPHFVKSRYIDDIVPFKQVEDYDENIVLYEKNVIENPFYFAVVYNKVEDVYYRIVYHGVNYLNEQGVKNTYQDSNYSIMKLNSEFQLVEEVFIPKGHYNFNIYFTTSAGLFLSTSNMNNPDLDEDTMVFDKIDFTK